MKLRGVVKGRTIELEVEPGFPDGEMVEVDLYPLEEPCHTPAEEPTPPDPSTADRRDTPAYRTFRPIPADGTVITNEMVNKIRETMGF